MSHGGAGHNKTNGDMDAIPSIKLQGLASTRSVLLTGVGVPAAVPQAFHFHIGVMYNFQSNAGLDEVVNID